MAPDARRLKDALYDHFARVGKALAAPKRLELLDLLSQSPRTVEALAAHSAISVANASQHLKVLRAARLVETERRGVHVEYRLADAAVGDFYVALRNLAETRITEVERVARDYFGARGALPEAQAVDGAELLRRVELGEVTLIDVRPREEYLAGHLPGAVSMPVDEIATRLHELPKRRDVVAYCRGRYCVMAADAVELLRGAGRRAFRLELGVADVRARGGRVVSEEARA
jgi:rhodanese-related sulfurtransferase/DNA-binding transcriptional ArsR family regulator